MPKKSRTALSWIADATRQLEAIHTPSARLDAELILAHTLHKPRTWLHAHGEAALSDQRSRIADARLQLRLEHVPVAYIIGHKEFYGRLFRVTPATLVPRPESETIIELLAQLITPNHTRLLDVGTGSGCLGITVKLEHPSLQVTLSDISQSAIAVARGNAEILRAEVKCIRSDLLDDISTEFDIILANLPYVDRSWDTPPDLAHEPAHALYADDGGLALIKKLLIQATKHLSHSGYMVLEADPGQHNSIISFADAQGYKVKLVRDYIIVLSR
ncbi:MAG: peptide chain release factor N(5)-glutamine methyltransferase [Candidatus Saccharimonas sp.]